MRLFIKTQGCPLCDLVKPYISKLKEQFKEDFTVYDIDTVDGMAEASFYDVYSVPTIIAGPKRYTGKDCVNYVKEIAK